MRRGHIIKQVYQCLQEVGVGVCISMKPNACMSERHAKIIAAVLTLRCPSPILKCVRLMEPRPLIMQALFAVT